MKLSNERKALKGTYIFLSIVFYVSSLVPLILYGSLLVLVSLPIAIMFTVLAVNVGKDNTKKDYYDCPICDGPTELKKVVKGKDTGKSFYVCCAYPYCTGRVKA